MLSGFRRSQQLEAVRKTILLTAGKPYSSLQDNESLFKEESKGPDCFPIKIKCW
jgi:hypothetical protein